MARSKSVVWVSSCFFSFFLSPSHYNFLRCTDCLMDTNSTHRHSLFSLVSPLISTSLICMQGEYIVVVFQLTPPPSHYPPRNQKKKIKTNSLSLSRPSKNTNNTHTHPQSLVAYLSCPVLMSSEAAYSTPGARVGVSVLPSRLISVVQSVPDFLFFFFSQRFLHRGKRRRKIKENK